jgi:hypothetical protein
MPEKEAVFMEPAVNSRSHHSMMNIPPSKNSWVPILEMVAIAVSLTFPVISVGQMATTIRIDARQPFVEPGPADFSTGTARSPSGQSLGLNSRFLTLNGKPWLPVMGEFHFSRYPESRWEEEILKMKSAGVNIISTYVFWIHHEELEGQFDWTGQRDLRAFTQLCGKHGIYVMARIGPWAHGEVRNGGFPDWVVKKSATRVNDPVYLGEVRAWYGQVGRQLSGLLWKDGGPVLGIQLENEYSQRGPGAGEAHILELKKIAIESGLDVPLYVITGWDNAAVPRGAVLPLYGGYPDAPWVGSLTPLPPQEVYQFRFKSRVTANMGAIGASDAPGVLSSTPNPVPYLTTEIGGANEVTYHRRPVLEADDIAAMMPVMLGSGVNAYGTYMFQGGENPEGKLTVLQESQATSYPNDVPVKSYDFQAPLGEFGEERASLRKMKVVQYFLNDFGAELAPMTVHPPNLLPKDETDLTVPRVSVRSRRDAGFVFLNNYVRGYAMPMRPMAQIQIQLPSGSLLIPRHPVDIPSGAYFIWPFNLNLEGAKLQYSTAQLFTKLESGDTNTIYFAAVRGIPAEFDFDTASIRDIQISSGEKTQDSGSIAIGRIKPGLSSHIDIVSATGKKLRIVVLSPEEAEDAWKVKIGGTEHLLITSQDFFADSASGQAWLHSRGTPDFNFAITPPANAPLSASLPLTKTIADHDAARFTALAPVNNIEVKCSQTQPAGEAPPVKTGPATSWRPHGVAQAPDEESFAKAARWSLNIPAGAMGNLSELFLEVNYQGDVARLSAGKRLLVDDFYNGHPWSVGLSRFLEPKKAGEFELSILPLRKDAPVFLDKLAPIQFPANGQVDRLQGLKLVPEYQLVLDIGGAK